MDEIRLADRYCRIRHTDDQCGSVLHSHAEHRHGHHVRTVDHWIHHTWIRMVQP